MNAVIYARYSCDRQTEQSIEGQLRECKAFAASEGIHIIGEYIDRAISGTTANRPEFQRMIADSRYKTFQAVIVYKLDRFARNRYDSAMYKSKLKANGVRVLSAKEHITDSPEGIILEGLLEAMTSTTVRSFPRRSSVACVRMPSRARLPAATWLWATASEQTSRWRSTRQVHHWYAGSSPAITAA